LAGVCAVEDKKIHFIFLTPRDTKDTKDNLGVSKCAVTPLKNFGGNGGRGGFAAVSQKAITVRFSSKI